MTTDYDIVINGAGIPGLLLALLLEKMSSASPLRILLLDRKATRPDDQLLRPPRSIADFDLRVFAITEASRRLFEHVNAWPSAESGRVYPYQQMHVWDAGGEGQIHFDAAELGTSSLGYITEGRVLLDCLVRRYQQSTSISLISDDELGGCHTTEGQINLSLQSGKSLTSKLLIGADGANSRVRQLAGIETVGWSYSQQAVVATVETEAGHQQTAWQRFLAEGPLAFLPMHKPWCSIVWSVSEQRAESLCELDKADFMLALGEDFQFRLGQIVDVGERARFPLRLSHAQAYTAARIALIADAAHTVHPLAGQGLNLGLQDVGMLADHLARALSKGQDIGARRILRAYERSRKGDNWLMQGSFDVLKRLFSNDQYALTLLRNMGLSTVNRLPVLKNAFVRKAMGL
jgi:2-octaprenylphenol hydroxylase